MYLVSWLHAGPYPSWASDTPWAGRSGVEEPRESWDGAETNKEVGSSAAAAAA